MLVMTFGTFDRFHPGHEYYLWEAKKLWDTLITIIARDKTVEHIKWKKPRDTEENRMNNVIASGLSDTVVLGSLSDPYQVLLTYRPDILCFWYDQNSFNNEKLGAFLKEHSLTPQIVRLQSFNPDKWKSSLL
jgi:cytidyltransferase-like protein